MDAGLLRTAASDTRESADVNELNSSEVSVQTPHIHILTSFNYCLQSAFEKIEHCFVIIVNANFL